jgi:2-(3-amino-3-carboxypropyl)histidine synthase
MIDASGPIGAPSAEANLLLPRPEDAPPSVPVAGVFREWGSDLFLALQSARGSIIALQVPAGLVKSSGRLSVELADATGARVVVVARACFGACDGPSADEVPGAQAVVALGHSPIPNVRLSLPTYFVEMRMPAERVPAIAEQIVGAGIPRRLGLLCSIQHLDLVEPLRRELEGRGFTVPVRTGDRRLAYATQALGCNYSSSEAVAGDVDAFLFLGTGKFHPEGLALATAKPVWSLDPLQMQVASPIDREALVAKRLLRVAMAHEAQRWGILVSSFAGQHRPAMVEALRRRATAAGRETTVLTFGRLDLRDLQGRELDAYVNTACPRIAIDDAPLFEKPVLTPPEFLMALDELPMAPYRFDTYR